MNVPSRRTMSTTGADVLRSDWQCSPALYCCVTNDPGHSGAKRYLAIAILSHGSGDPWVRPTFLPWGLLCSCSCSQVVAGARVILKSSSFTWVFDAGCQQRPQLGSNTSKWPPCLAGASSQHGGWFEGWVSQESQMDTILFYDLVSDATQHHFHCSLLL